MLTQETNLFTLGKMYEQNNYVEPPRFMYCTLELPWIDNKKFISCIPAGDYIMRPWNSPKFGKVFYIESQYSSVVGLNHGERTHILFHTANMTSQLKGCIAIGTHLGYLTNKNNDQELSVLNSRDSMQNLLEELGDYDYRLTILRR